MNVDRDKCMGYGNCAAAAPQVFDLDEEDGRALVLIDPVPLHLHASADEAVAACPAAALTVTP
jgi:ferredoxin